MNFRLKLVTLSALVGGASAGAVLLRNQYSHAADHLDPPTRTNPAMGGTDHNADIADVYAWHQGTGASATLVTILTFGGPNPPTPTQAIPCDRDVLYTIYIDNTGDAMPEFNIRARFAQDSTMNCFVQIEGIPGTTAPIVGPVEYQLGTSSVKAYAGLRDDAFFFDLTGFRETLSMGSIRMTNDRDFFAGQNTPAIVIEMPLAAAQGAGTNVKIWATTARAQ